MPQINILNILQGDNQSNIVDKINYNFDQILSAGGGPQGQQGLIGPTGPIGPQGPQGPQGLQGPSGTKWFVQDSSPASGAVTGSNPWTYPSIGDYWLDPDSADQDVYVFTATGWTYTGYGLAAGQLFQKVSPVNFNGGITGQAILIAGTASPQAVVFSDSSINGITGYVPSGTAIDNINYENSKLKISTRNDRTKIISFGHSDFDTLNASGLSPATGNYTWNPSIDWDASSPISNAFYDIRFQNPTGAITISSLGTINGGVNLFANQEVSAQSASENVILKTSSVNKGTFIDASNVGGFLELSNNSPTPVNQANAPLFANSTGLGLGLGTGQFKQSGSDTRRLAVLGNVTIGKSPTYHTQTLFEGYGPAGRDSGFLYVEGPAGFGRAMGPTAIGNGVTTGPAESQNVFPQVFISSSEGGPALSVASVVGPSRTGRTVIGNGNYDNAAGNTIASIGVDLTQEYYFAGGKGSTFSGGPMFSYQHKITDSTNTANTAPVFGITTYALNGSYNNNTVATGTFIQTTNSNHRLFIQANATSSGRGNDNRLSLGTNQYNKVTLWGGSNSDEYGTVSIGPNSDSFSGTRSVLLYDTSFPLTLTASKGANIYPNYQTPDHSLFVSGYQTIGAPDTISMFKDVAGIASDGFGYHTKLKIHRNLGTSTSLLGGETIVDGNYPGDYSNGLEITSLVPRSPIIPKAARPSFAFGVGAMDALNRLVSIPAQRNFANTTGFFISDTGERVSIGYDISTGNLSSGAALSVSGPAGATAIYAVGNIGLTGDLNVTGNSNHIGNSNRVGNSLITGNVNVTGDVSIENTYDLYTSSIVGQLPTYNLSLSGNVQMMQQTGPGTGLINTGTAPGGPGSLYGIEVTYRNVWSVDINNVGNSPPNPTSLPGPTYYASGGFKGFIVGPGASWPYGSGLFHFNILPVPYDRMISYAMGGTLNHPLGGTIEANVRWGRYPYNWFNYPTNPWGSPRAAVPGTDSNANDLYRFSHSPYGGNSFFIPANRWSWFYLQTSGISPGNFLNTVGGYAYVWFFEIKMGQ